MKFKFLLYRIKELFLNNAKRWDALAQTESSVVNFAHDNINPEPEKFSGNTMHYSLAYCLASSGESINARFRSDHSTDIDLQIRDALAVNHTKTPLILYRGVCEHVYQQMLQNAANRKHIDLYEKGFMSTSLIKSHEIPSEHHLRIYAPAGTSCMYMGDVNDELAYYEVVIQCGSSLRIESIDEKYINCRLIDTY